MTEEELQLVRRYVDATLNVRGVLSPYSSFNIRCSCPFGGIDGLKEEIARLDAIVESGVDLPVPYEVWEKRRK